MKVTIEASKASGPVAAPPSKSMAHRLLICAGLARGESTVKGLDMSQDVLATMDCLKALGAEIRQEGEQLKVRGADPFKAAGGVLHCRESGSTLRFFVPIALLSEEKLRFTGTEKLLSRPLEIYERLCADRALYYSKAADSLTVSGPLKAGEFSFPGDVSSQFVSGLLFALPLLEEDSCIRLIPPVESRSYINMTVSAMARFGVDVRWQDENSLYIPGGQHYLPAELSVEGDYSNAAFLEALNELGGSVTVEGLRPDSLQGDRVYRQHFKALRQSGARISLADCPDLGPVLFALAAANKGGLFTDTRRLRIKESDRAEAMARELRKLGADISVGDDFVEIHPSVLKCSSEPLWGHNDHRVVMSLAVLLTRLGGSIEGAEAVSKSWPGFFESIEALGIRLRRGE